MIQSIGGAYLHVIFYILTIENKPFLKHTCNTDQNSHILGYKENTIKVHKVEILQCSLIAR